MLLLELVVVFVDLRPELDLPTSITLVLLAPRSLLLLVLGISRSP